MTILLLSLMPLTSAGLFDYIDNGTPDCVENPTSPECDDWEVGEPGDELGDEPWWGWECNRASLSAPVSDPWTNGDYFLCWAFGVGLPG